MDVCNWMKYRLYSIQDLGLVTENCYFGFVFVPLCATMCCACTDEQFETYLSKCLFSNIVKASSAFLAP